MLEGDNAYLCAKCDKKVDTLKRTCVKELPRFMIISLKRFEFDFDRMIRVKVNDYCEFPLELDMFPYTQEGL
jgi:ubiquitin carboxyl-terminal hydrolase 9/24